MCTNGEVVDSLGQEMCVTIDIALAGSSCEVIVESFYSVVSSQKMGGGQLNEVLVHRSIVDWCIPHPISSPNTMEQIAMLYMQGNRKHGLSKHRLPCLTDERLRAFSRYSVSKVIDRLRHEIKATVSTFAGGR